MSYDLVIKGGDIATAEARYSADIGIKDGKIAEIAEGLSGSDEINAAGRLVMPGGIETHCHIAQESGMGLMCTDDYESGSRAAAFGGNSSFVPFAAQRKGWGRVRNAGYLRQPGSPEIVPRLGLSPDHLRPDGGGIGRAAQSL